MDKDFGSTAFFYNTQVTKLEESVAVMGNTLTQLVELVSAKRE